MILNLTQHSASPEQVAAGVVDLEGTELALLKTHLDFLRLTDRADVLSVASFITGLAEVKGATHAMIGGAPFLMGPLEKELRGAGIVPLYAFSVRESVEEKTADGSIRKTAVFRHLGFVEGCL